MQFDLTAVLGQFTGLVLMITIAVKLIETRLSADKIVGLLRYIVAIVFCVWIVGLLPKTNATSELAGCIKFESWRECGGWPIFQDLLGGLAQSLGDSLLSLLSFSPEISGFLAAIYFAMRVNMGHYASDKDVFKTALGILLIMSLILYLPWVSAEFNEMVLWISNLSDEMSKGRENLHIYFSNIETYRLAASRYSPSIIDYGYYSFRISLWVLTVIPSIVGTMAFLGQLIILYGVPFCIFQAIFTAQQNLETPVSLIIRYAGIAIVKALTWAAVSTISVDSLDTIENSIDYMTYTLNMWNGLSELALFSGIYLVAGVCLFVFILTPAITDIFNPGGRR